MSITLSADPSGTFGSIKVNSEDQLKIYSDGKIKNSVGEEIKSFQGFAYKNKIINGNFDIWQRANSQTLTGFGSDDRWMNNNVGCTKTHSKQVFPLGQTEVPGNPTYFSRTVVVNVVGASNYVQKTQSIEDVKTLSGKTCTLSFWAKADSTKNISVDLIQYMGTGGSPSAPVDGIGLQLVNLTSTWKKYSITVDIPSVAGKTIGTDGNDHLRLRIFFNAGTTYSAISANLGQQSGTFDIAQVQLEEGSVATDFEQRPFGLELYLCQRYFQIGIFGGGSAYYYGGANGAGYNAGSLAFNPPMRTTPSISLHTGASNSFINCSFHSTLISAISITYRVTVIATSSYCAYLGTHDFDAEL